MKKIAKVCALSALALLIPGVVLLGVGAVLGGNFNKAMSQNGFYPGMLFGGIWKYEHTTSMTVQEYDVSGKGSFYLPDGVENVTNLEIEVEAESVQLNKGDAFSVVNQGLEDEQITSYMDGTIWHIEVTGRRNNRGSLEIIVPETKTFDMVSLHSDVGQITGSGVDAVYFNADTDKGKIKLSDVNAQSMQLDADVGTIEIYGTVQNTARLNADVGTVKLMVPKPAEYGYDITCELGNVTLFDESMNGMSVRRQASIDREPMFQLNCELGKVQVLETEGTKVRETCWQDRSNAMQSVKERAAQQQFSTTHQGYCS